MFNPALVLLVTALAAMVAFAVEFRWDSPTLRLSSLLIGPFLIVSIAIMGLLRLCRKKLPIFFEQPVDDDCGGDIVLCLKDTDLDIVSGRCTVEEYADVA